jgi:hypothetical protein
MNFLYSTGKTALGAFLLLVIGLALIGYACSPRAPATGASPLILIALGVLLLLGIVALILAKIHQYAERVTHIEVCPHGLRWTKKEQARMATWAEIKGIFRKLVVTGRAGNPDRYDVMTITFRSGEKLRLSWDMITDYPRFANTLQSCVADENKRIAFGQAGGFVGRAFSSR